MKKRIRKAISFITICWGTIWFFVGLILLYPFFLTAIFIPKWRKKTFYLNKIWAYIIYASLFVRAKKEYRVPLDRKLPYIFCANHTSMLDIPIIGLTAPHYFIFVGKASLANVPLFGFVYKRLNILVDRSSRLSSYQCFKKAKEMIDMGHSIAMFPEGGINRVQIPGLARFKDGAFRTAIEKQVPVVPVTILNNWKVLYAYNIDFHWYPTKVIYHAPISTIGMTIADTDSLRNQVMEIIREELTQATGQVVGADSLKASKEA